MSATRSSPPEPTDDLPRYAPQLALPPYRFLPGRDPHPTAHPDGHMAQRPQTPPRTLRASHWQEHADYLFAFDLYNRGFFWEAHELWEGLWRAGPPGAFERALLQGLILLAAARLKARMRDAHVAQRLLARARLRLQDARAASGACGAAPLGVDLGALLAAIETANPATLDVDGPSLLLHGLTAG